MHHDPNESGASNAPRTADSAAGAAARAAEGLADATAAAASAAPGPPGAVWHPGGLILIAGPTGTGKSALSLDLAEALVRAGHPVEIVNADAYQLYRGMDIGTAKLAPEHRRGIPHHLFDVLELHEASTVADYQSLARQTIAEVQQRGATPVLVGGSGLYISAVLHEFEFPGTEPAVRERLEQESASLGRGVLWQRLNELDPQAASAISMFNERRVIRALEVIELTGRPYSANLPEGGRLWQPAVQFFLDGDRDILRSRLRLRAEQMWQQGLLEEVSQLLERGLAQAPTARRAIGYAQAMAVLAGTQQLEDGITETEQLTLRYARRQRSWFNRFAEMVRLDYLSPRLLDEALTALGQPPAPAEN